MKSVIPFFLAGTCTLIAFLIPGLQEEDRYLKYALYFGPAWVFALIAAFEARPSLSTGQVVAVFLVSLGAYFTGILSVSRFRPIDLGLGNLFISPAVGAAVLLSGVAAIKFRRRTALHPIIMGSVLSWLSAVPLWLWLEFRLIDRPLAWGLHILCWYVAVGPYAVRILKGEIVKSAPAMLPAQ